MEVEFKKNSANELQAVLLGERHTFPNLLRETLLEDQSVEFAAYMLPHPWATRQNLCSKQRESRPKRHWLMP